MPNDRKFPRNMENPIDNLIIDIGRKTYPFYRKLNLTPNLLTFISLILGLLSSYLFVIKNYRLSALTYFLSYIYDALDGNYARTYNMATTFGDYFDHIKDLIVNIIFIVDFIKYTNYSNDKLIIIIIVTIILFLTLSIHLGCQEQWVKKNDPNQVSGYLTSVTKILHIGNCTDYIHILKYFGCGTFALWISFIILFSHK